MEAGWLSRRLLQLPRDDTSSERGNEASRRWGLDSVNDKE